MMTHNGIAHARIWRKWEKLHRGSVRIFCHQSAASPITDTMDGVSFLRKHLLATSIAAGWGTPSFCEALLRSCQELLSLDGNWTHVAVVSGTHIPIVRLDGPSRLPPNGTSLLAAMYPHIPDAAAPYQRHLRQARFRFDRKLVDSLKMHQTWVVLARPHVQVLVSRLSEVLQLAHDMHEALMEVQSYREGKVLIDELLINSALQRWSAPDQDTDTAAANRAHTRPFRDEAVTAVHFSKAGDLHPITWTQLDQNMTTSFYRNRRSLRYILRLHNRAMHKPWYFFRKVNVTAADENSLLSELQELWSLSMTVPGQWS